MRVTADEALASLENVGTHCSNFEGSSFISFSQDTRALEGLKKSIANVIPDLEREYDELMRELEHEQAEVAEIEAGDQDYLNELKATIAEQK